MNSKRAHILLLALLLSSAPSIATAANSNKAAAFFYRIGEWVDRFQLRGLDTAYITLPEHSWRVALTTGGTGTCSYRTGEEKQNAAVGNGLFLLIHAILTIKSFIYDKENQFTHLCSLLLVPSSE